MSNLDTEDIPGRVAGVDIEGKIAKMEILKSGQAFLDMQDRSSQDCKEYLINGRQIRELTIILSYLCDKFAVPAIREINSLDQVDDFVLTEKPKKD